VTVRRLSRYEVIEIRWLSGIENLVSEGGDFVFNSFRNFKPFPKTIVQRVAVVKLEVYDGGGNWLAV